MSIEITNTTPRSMYADQVLPDGTHTFTVVEVTKKYGKKGGEFFVWKLAYENGVGEQVLLPNMMGDLLRVLACEETEPGTFKWNTLEQPDKTFSATVSHVPDTKDSSVIRQHMKNFLPF